MNNFSLVLYCREGPHAARRFSLSSFSAFSKRSMAPQSWVLTHSASSVSPSSRLIVGLRFRSFRAFVLLMCSRRIFLRISFSCWNGTDELMESANYPFSILNASLFVRRLFCCA